MAGAKKENTLYALSRSSRCYGCDSALAIDDIVRLAKKQDESEVYCLRCSDLADYVFLPKGNSNITRLAKKYAQSPWVIVKWSEIWKTYERQGILVDQQAAARAKDEAGN